MKQALLALLIASAACDEGNVEVRVKATTRTVDGVDLPTPVSVKVVRYTSLGHGDYDDDPLTVEVEAGATASDLVPAVAVPPEPSVPHSGAYEATLGAVDELHLQIDGASLHKAMPTLIAALTAPSPGAVATVVVTAAAGDRVSVTLDDGSGIERPECGATTDGVRFDVLPSCVSTPGRYRMLVFSGRHEGQSEDREIDGDERVTVDWDLKRYAYVSFDVP